MASKRSRLELEEEERGRENQAIALIRAAAKAASKTVAKDEFARIFAEAELIIARRLGGKKPRNLSGNGQVQSESSTEGGSLSIQSNLENEQSASPPTEQESGGTPNAQRLPAWYQEHMSYYGPKGRKPKGPKPKQKTQEEIEAERIRIATGIHREFVWNTETNTWMPKSLVRDPGFVAIKPGSRAFKDVMVRRHLEGWLSDDRGRAMWDYMKDIKDDNAYGFSDIAYYYSDTLSVGSLQTLRQALEYLANTSWELCELWNFMLLTRYHLGNKSGGSRGFGGHDAERLKEYISLVKTITEKKLIPHRPIPWRKFFYYEPPSVETLRHFRLVYHPCGLLVADTFVGGQYTPPTFQGEERLAVVQFYKNGGIWLDREAMVGPIEPKPKYRNPGKKQEESRVIDALFISKETLQMREIQKAFREWLLVGGDYEIRRMEANLFNINFKKDNKAESLLM